MLTLSSMENLIVECNLWLLPFQNNGLIDVHSLYNFPPNSSVEFLCVPCLFCLFFCFTSQSTAMVMAEHSIHLYTLFLR